MRMTAFVMGTNSFSIMKQKEAVVQFRPIAWTVVQRVSSLL
jgi:hypothetical protein